MKTLKKIAAPSFSPKTLVQAIAIGLLAMSSSAVASTPKEKTERNSPNYGTDIKKFQTIGDLEIYQAAQSGTVTMTMMLDMSGSMLVCDGSEQSEQLNSIRLENYKMSDVNGVPLKTIEVEDEVWEKGKFVTKKRSVDVSKGFNVAHTYCANGKRNRLSELKHAVISVFADGRALPSNYKIGFGTYPSRGNFFGGRIVVPAKPLTASHRYRLIRQVMGLSAMGMTPSAHAYAEAGAYMLGGTTTKFSNTDKTPKVGYIPNAILTHDKIHQPDYRQFYQCEFYGMIGPDPEYRWMKQDGKWVYDTSQYRKTPLYGSFFDYSGNPVTTRSGWDFFGKPFGSLAYTMGHTDLVSSFRSKTWLDNWGWAAIQQENWMGCALGPYATLKYGDKVFAFGDLSRFDVTNAVSGSGWTKDSSPVSLGKYNSNFKALDLGYLGVINAVHDPINKKTLEITEGTTPDLRLVSDDPVLVGEKVNYLPEDHTDANSKYSGFSVSAEDAKIEDLSRYKSPVEGEVATCDGFGIYFLTDGFPNYNSIHTHQMARSLGYSATVESSIIEQLVKDSGGKYNLPSTTSEGVSDNNSGWNAIGAYAAILRDPIKNKKGITVKTATMGFGADFDGDPKTKEIANADGTTTTVVDCDSYSRTDIKNLCKLGAKGYGYGEGGFYTAKGASAVSSSIIDFAGSLTQRISTQPAGTISVPKDPLSVSNIQPYAYLPMIEPQLTKPNLLWRGNLKKYHTLNGTLYSKDAQSRLYKKAANPTYENKNYPSQFDPTVMDIWQNQSATGNDDDGSPLLNGSINVGGTYENVGDIRKDQKNSRIVYMEVHKIDSTTGKVIKELVDVGIKDKVLYNFDKLDKFYTVEDKVYLLNFLGVPIPTEIGIPTTDAELQKVFNNVMKGGADFNVPLMGGVVHSVPTLASYKGQFQADGDIESDESKREDHLIYGSMDGALHMVRASTGTEDFAFIPRAMFEDKQQRNALLVKSIYDRTGEPKFGVDAPWTTYAEYIYDFTGKVGEIKAQKMYAFGGLRMGGNGIYGLDITNKTTPKLNFSIDKSTEGFGKMGQVWSKPIVAKIRVSNTGKRVDQFKDVVIFGGGYDMCYEHPLFKLGQATPLLSYENSNTDALKKGAQKLGDEYARCTQTSAMGAAVYMVDAKNGKLIASWENDGSSDDRKHMKHSVVGEIATLDSNNNGAIDHLYFADLGGQVFRVDLKELEQGKAMTRRVVRVLDANGDTSSKNNDKHINFRFYDKPLISFYDHNGKNGKQSFAVVNIASGDRSSPVHTHRGTENANRIFGFFDRDLTTNKLDRANLGLEKLLTRDITSDNLMKIDTKDVETIPTKAAEIVKQLQSGVESFNALNRNTDKQGWYYDMIRFDGRINVSGLKSIGTGTVLGNVYYANVYSPSYDYTTGASCTARVSGGTERQMYCLPWGICTDSENGHRTTTRNGVLGYIKAGPGIQDLAVGTVTNSKNKSGAFRAILGHQMLSEVTNAKEDIKKTVGGDVSSSLGRLPAESVDKVTEGVGTGADINGGNVLVSPKYTLAVQRWYDLQNENQANN